MTNCLCRDSDDVAVAWMWCCPGTHRTQLILWQAYTITFEFYISEIRVRVPCMYYAELEDLCRP